MIISDIHGLRDTSYIQKYVAQLQSSFSITLIDSKELAGIDEHLGKDETHQKFINGGINRAVERITEQINSVDIVLAFSIGGIIAWRACLKSNFCPELICVSSTRLRKETDKPKCDIQLYYGSEDDFRPNEDWADRMDLVMNIINKGHHEIYKEDYVIEKICKAILKHRNS